MREGTKRREDDKEQDFIQNFVTLKSNDHCTKRGVPCTPNETGLVGWGGGSAAGIILTRRAVLPSTTGVKVKHSDT